MSNLTNTILITGTNNFNPTFLWQVGFDEYSSQDDLQFRATIRPISNIDNSSRIPNPTVLYEETGILLTDVNNLGSWTFGIEKNILAIGGPYRDYQVVIESHDSNGNTSAGNTCGSSNENGWSAFPFGYDILNVYNPRQTGIELTSQLLTQNSGNGDYITGGYGYSSRQFIGPNGEVTIKFNSGSFDTDLVGGFLYISHTQFPKAESLINTGYWGNRVQKSRFDFDPRIGFAHHPNAAFNVRGIPNAYISVSFFDELDRILLDDQGIDISTGLYLSNNAKIYSDAAAGSISLGGGVTLSSVTTTGYPSNNTRLKQLIGSGTELTRTTTLGNNLDIPANITTIIYASLPINNFYSGVNGNYILQDRYLDDGGLGGDSVSYPFGSRSPGGFSGDNRVLMSDGTTKKISQIQKGDSVKSFRLDGSDIVGNVRPFNYQSDNWQNAHGLIRDWNFLGYHHTGIVAKVHTNTVLSYLKLNYASGKSIFVDYPTLLTKNSINIFSATNEGTFIMSETGLANGSTLSSLRPGNTPDVQSNQLISTIEFINSPLTVYNLEVEPFKTFHIVHDYTSDSSYNSLLVHDAVTDY